MQLLKKYLPEKIYKATDTALNQKQKVWIKN